MPVSVPSVGSADNAAAVSPPATLLDVARRVGTTTATVSKVLNNKGKISADTRQSVLRVADELGYHADPAARSLRTRSSGLVAVFGQYLDQGAQTDKAVRLQNLLLDRGHDASIFSTGSRPDAQSNAPFLRQLIVQRPRAIACSVHFFGNEVWRELERYQKGGGTVVCYDHPAPLECDQVLFDRENNNYQAGRHLLEIGHRDIGLYLVQAGPALSEPRRQGFQRALDESGVPLREEWVFWGWSSGDDGVALADRFLALPKRPTGLCIVNDQVALAFASALLRRGVRIPGELSLVTLDDQPMARHFPVPLTAVSHPADQIARAVADLLQSRLDGTYVGPPRQTVVRGTLTVRESTAAARPPGP